MRWVIVVDAYSSGNLLAPAFRKFDPQCRCLHVRSVPRTETYDRQFLAETFDQEIDLPTLDQKSRIAFEAKLEQVTEGGPVAAVIPGAECGVPAADAISEWLNVASNGTSLSAARRDKQAMHDAIARAGVRAIKQLACRSSSEAVEWARERGNWPVVLKPPHSAGTDGVTLCSDAASLEREFCELIDRRNHMDLVNDRLLVQECLFGTEYIVDTVSSSGQHVVVDVRRYRKIARNGAAFVYDRVEMVDPSSAAATRLAGYVGQVLDSLGIRFGPAHAEVFIDAKGPVLVEVGARLCGGWAPRVVAESIGLSQVDFTVLAYLAPERFQQAAGRALPILRPSLTVFLIATKAGLIRSIPIEQVIEDLPSRLTHHMFVQPGDPLRPTVDFSTMPGIVDLVSDTTTRLESDYRRLRAAESAGYDFHPAKT